MLDKWDEEEKWAKEHPFRAFPGKAFDFVWYTIPRILNDARYEVKWGFQRMFRGFDDRWYWSYYSMNAEQTVKVLKRMQKHKHGAPFTTDPDNVIDIKDEDTLTDDKYDVNKKHFDRWNKALGLMIAGFEALIKEDDVHILDENGKYDHEASQKERERLMAKWEKGAKLFVANYRGLWD